MFLDGASLSTFYFYTSVPPHAPDVLEGASKAPFLQYILFGNPFDYFAWQAQGPEVDSPNPHKKTNAFLTGTATQPFMGLDVQAELTMSTQRDGSQPKGIPFQMIRNAVWPKQSKWVT